MYKIKKFNLARNALYFFIQEFNIKELYIPYYLCDVVRHTLFNAGCNIKFYHINDSFFPERKFNKNDFILYPNYFGVFRDNVEKLVSYYPNIIIDNAHAYYEKPLGLACFNAGHKFGHKDSILWYGNSAVTNNLNYAENDNAKKLYKKFVELHKIYSPTNQLNINIEKITSPFVYPYLAESTQMADILVNKLTKEGKIIYRYWNNLPKSFNEYKFYSRLVPIPLIEAVD